MTPEFMGLSITVAPEIGRWITGPASEETVEKVSATVRSVTSANTEIEAMAALAGDALMTGRLRWELVHLVTDRNVNERRAETCVDSFWADQGKTERAPADMSLHGSSTVQWAAVAVSVVVLTTFGIVMELALTRSVPAGSETLLNMLLGTLAAMATSTVSYWLGSSAGSAAKNDLLIRSRTPQRP